MEVGPLEDGGCREGSGSREDMAIIWFDQERCRQARLFYPVSIAYWPRIGVRQRDFSRCLIACLFQTVVLSWFAYLRPTASHRCPSSRPWGAENHVGLSERKRSPWLCD
jgi:hypothetical protein